MKRLLFVASMFVAGSSFAQDFEATIKQAYHPTVNTGERVADTVFTYLTRGTAFFSYGAPGGGNAIGNGHADPGTGTAVQVLDAVGMHYDGVANAAATEILVWFAEGVVMGAGPDNITGAVYTVNTDSTPNAMLGSGTITTADADLAGGLTSIMLTAPAPLAGQDFAVTVEWGAADDTIGIVGSQDGDGAGEERVLGKFTPGLGGVWQHGAPYQNFDLDAMIFPVLDIVAGLEAYSNGLAIENVYPNPALETAVIPFNLDQSEVVSVRVMDVTGKVVYTESSQRGSGQHLVELNTGALEAGNYYYTISTAKASLTSKFIVTK